MKYSDLTIRERAALIKLGVANGMHSLGEIKDMYHQYEDGGFMDWLKGIFSSGSPEEVENSPSEPAPLDLAELAVRQAYAESNFNSNAKSGVGAREMFQIMPNVIADYNKENKTSYTVNDLIKDDVSIDIRNWYMNSLQNREWNTKNNPTDSVQFGKSLAAYNYGTGNVLKALNKAKENGVNVYSSWDWLSYMPSETQDYINFILRNQDVNTTQKNNSMYQSSLGDNNAKVEVIKKKIRSTGGPLYPFSFSKQPIPEVRY